MRIPSVYERTLPCTLKARLDTLEEVALMDAASFEGRRSRWGTLVGYHQATRGKASCAS